MERQQISISRQKDRRTIPTLASDATLRSSDQIEDPKIAGQLIFTTLHRAWGSGDASEPERYFPEWFRFGRCLRFRFLLIAGLIVLLFSGRRLQGPDCGRSSDRQQRHQISRDDHRSCLSMRLIALFSL